MMTNRYLTGNLKPMINEIDAPQLNVIGTIPPELHGAFMRNGPNPQFDPLSYTYPYDGDGMIHAIYLQNGKAHYRNRFVETKELLAERRANKALYGGIAQPHFPDPAYLLADDVQDPIKAGRFINVIRHANRYLALNESASAYEIDAQLHTLGEWKINNQALAMSPHVRLDPHTGELYLIEYNFEPPYLHYHVIDKQGESVKSFAIDMPYSSMMHDFILTEHYIVVFDFAVIADIQNYMAGKGLYHWEPERGARIGIIARDGSQPTEWINTPAFFSFHFANGYERDHDIIIDYVHYDVFHVDPDEARLDPPSSFNRLTIDTIKKTATSKAYDERRMIEFPRINDNYQMRSHRYVYMAGLEYAPPKDFLLDTYNAIIKYDTMHARTQVHDFGQHALVSEPVYVPRPNSQQEDDGYIILFVYDQNRDTSECVILSAEQIENEPVARIELPQRVPQGLHGSWFEGTSI